MMQPLPVFYFEKLQTFHIFITFHSFGEYGKMADKSKQIPDDKPVSLSGG